jgi:hypothetical protein
LREFQSAVIVANASKNEKLHFAEAFEIHIEKTKDDIGNLVRALDQ